MTLDLSSLPEGIHTPSELLTFYAGVRSRLRPDLERKSPARHRERVATPALARVMPRVRYSRFAQTYKALTGLDRPPAELRLPLTIDRRVRIIIAAVAWKYGVSVRDMKSPRRSKLYVAARYEAMARIIKKTSLSYPRVGKIFGLDHTTVLYGVKKFNRQAQLSPICTQKR